MYSDVFYASEGAIMDGCDRVCPDDDFSIRQVFPIGLPWAQFYIWARCGCFFIIKMLYISTYQLCTFRSVFYPCLSRSEWVDHIGLDSYLILDGTHANFRLSYVSQDLT